MIPYSPIPRIVVGSNHLQLIHRLIRPDAPPSTQRVDLLTTSFRRVSLIDTGAAPREQVAEGDTAIHILWQMNEADAAIWIEGDRAPIAPGDTVMIPGGDRWQLSPHTLATLVASRVRQIAVPILPTHGVDIFNGYNRESRYPRMADFGLSRWKLTGVLKMGQIATDRMLVSLVGDIAIRHDGGITMLHQGGARVIRPESGSITLVPNGLSYVLVID